MKAPTSHCFIITLSLLILFNPITIKSLKGESLQTKNEDPINIKSERMISYNKKDMVSFIGNVVAVKKKITIYADKMDVYTSGKARLLKKIISTGRVKIVMIDKEDPQKKGVAKADKVIYEKDKNILTLIGNASVKDNNNIIEGDKIIYNIDKESMVSYGRDKNRAEIIIFETKK